MNSIIVPLPSDTMTSISTKFNHIYSQQKENKKYDNMVTSFQEPYTNYISNRNLNIVLLILLFLILVLVL